MAKKTPSKTANKRGGKQRTRGQCPRRRLFVTGGLVIAAALGAGLWLGLSGGPPPVGLEVGMRAPDFSLDDLDGQTVRLSDFRGRPVLLYFWQTNCPACREAFPTAIDLAQTYADDGLALVTVSLDHSEDTLRAYVEAHLPEGVYTLWGSYEEAMAVIDLYGMPHVPHPLLIDRQGVIHFRGSHVRLPMDVHVQEIL